MDQWLKLLIAAACCVVIAGGTYFAWTKWEDRNARIAYREALAANRAELFSLAEAHADDTGKVEAFCRVLQRRPTIVTPPAASRRVLSNCYSLSFL